MKDITGLQDAWARRVALEEYIRRAFVDEAKEEFWPDHLEREGFGTRAEVIDLLSDMVLAKKLRSEMRILCALGHQCWTGTPKQVTQLLSESTILCEDCAQEVEILQAYLALCFRVSEWWRRDLAR